MPDQFQTVDDFLRCSGACVLVSVVAVKGSTPREAGAFMLVSPLSTLRTIGGGQLEYMAIDHARQMLKSGGRSDVANISLGPEIGQCCGGHVSLNFQLVDAEISRDLIETEAGEGRARPHVYIFGAGHVGNALARAFALLPVRAVLVDNRQSDLDHAPQGVERRLVAMPESVVREAPTGSVFLVLTHDHALDFLIVSEALSRSDAAYAGMIGSKSKRGTFSHWFRRQGGNVNALERLVCPMGGSTVKDKRPEVIASLVAAEVITALFSMKVTAKPGVPAIA